MAAYKHRTLLVGLDAACWEYLDPLLEAGRLPTLQALKEAGAWGRLDSTWPPLTPAAWSSIVTGKNPGKHGIFDMLWRRPGTYDFLPISGQNRAGTPFWKLLNKQGLRVGLVNVPFTYPPEPLDGFVVTGFGAPNSASDFAYPGEALEYIRHRWPDFKPNAATEVLQNGSPDQVLAVERRHQEMQVDIAVDLAGYYSVDVLVINLMLLDHANHKMPDMQRVQEAMCASDTDLGRLIDGFQPESVLLISDHGSRRVKGNFLLHAWLHDQGYLEYAPRPVLDQDQQLNWVLKQWLEGQRGLSGLPEKIARRLLRGILSRLDGRASEMAWNTIEAQVPFARQAILNNGQIDFNRTRVFPAAIYSGMLYLNLVGRDPQGVVVPEGLVELAEELRGKLLALLDPAGVPLLSQVLTAGQIFHGPAASQAPDLLLDNYASDWSLQARSYTPSAGEAHERYFVSCQGNYGWHSRVGVFVFSGTAFKSGSILEQGHVLDIPATLLHLHGLPIPEDYDGQVLTESFEPAFLRENPVSIGVGDGGNEGTQSAGELTEAESAMLTDHLRALGYLE